ncbi:hypothetical protein LMH87_002618 [Akanthomyces muscarius]|uniref:Uncharacterized protein n=1 Tax=Akanthomyces muscarius TaxID=2231603 RepID=A0A9W8UJU8_AKAMU|nr:hypothetical protein LMH87_002618 [Akanthomyces muscarius]KAJ4148133.1 hypothetical protein LMH87_002618 [Akanthomyces muscarius]
MNSFESPLLPSLRALVRECVGHPWAGGRATWQMIGVPRRAYRTAELQHPPARSKSLISRETAFDFLALQRCDGIY